MMPPSSRISKLRVLIIDDNRAIHEDFRKILCPAPLASDLTSLENELFGEDFPSPEPDVYPFEIDSAFQGQDAIPLVEKAQAQARPYAVAFVDMRMPPGWDGVETIENLWRVDPDVQVVICSAYSDNPWKSVTDRLGLTDRLFILRKPFDNIEVLQSARALGEKWSLHLQVRDRLKLLDALVEERTCELDQANQVLASANKQLRDEMEQRRRVEEELVLSQKLEAIGRLAGGIAHEINTPAQYVGDNLRFLQSSFLGLLNMVDEYERFLETVSTPLHSASLVGLTAAQEAADLVMIRSEALPAFEESISGIDKIASIVKEFKDFARPDSPAMCSTDLNELLNNVIEVARPEYQDLAQLRVDFSPLPPVQCQPGQMRHVFLSLLLNAAQAVADSDAGAQKRGLIVVTTRVDGGGVRVEVRDNGCGIPMDKRGQVFSPFFTTRSFGLGRGQGLATARAVVVNRHQGQMGFSSEVGEGTVFSVWLPASEDSRE